jgi:hypothetical protein
MAIIGIDVMTADVDLLIEELDELWHVDYAEAAGQYREDSNYSQVHVYTDLAEDQLEDWLSANSEADYVGTFEV